MLLYWDAYVIPLLYVPTMLAVDCLPGLKHLLGMLVATSVAVARDN